MCQLVWPRQTPLKKGWFPACEVSFHMLASTLSDVHAIQQQPHDPPASSDYQVPYDQEGTQPCRRTECPHGRAWPLRRLLELLVSAAHIVGRVQRVGNKLLDVRRLRGEISHQQVLELRDLDEGLLGSSASELVKRHME
jgi:hypothetical protein